MSQWEQFQKVGVGVGDNISILPGFLSMTPSPAIGKGGGGEGNCCTGTYVCDRLEGKLG